MKTLWGINPSRPDWTSPDPVWSNLLRRGVRFERTTEDGVPTGQPVSLDALGYPLTDGQTYGVRIAARGTDLRIGNMVAISHGNRMTLRQSGGGLIVAYGKDVIWEYADLRRRHADDDVDVVEGGFDRWSLERMQKLGPAVVRTLDWERTNERRDLALPRTSGDYLLQGSAEGVALEHQVRLANLLGAHLWWCAPPRYGLSAADWRRAVVERLGMLTRLHRAPIIEYGNELWNAGFPVHQWLTDEGGGDWVPAACAEIRELWSACDDVFGEGGLAPSYLRFVGGHVARPEILAALLRGVGERADLAGPACYAGGRKSDRDVWGADVDDATILASCSARLAELEGLLDDHRAVIRSAGVRFGMALYEVGIDLHADHRPWRPAALRFNRSQSAGALIDQVRRMIQRRGARLACWYSSCTDQDPAGPLAPFGFWGHQRDGVLPKCRAAMRAFDAAS